MNGGRQPLSLGRNCYSQGTIIHEFIHAIGFDHEQNRPDRDNYVKIMWGNIKGGRGNNNFWKANGWRMFDTEYDWKSVMHYGAYGGSINGRPTMTSRVSIIHPGCFPGMNIVFEVADLGHGLVFSTSGLLRLSFT